MQMILDLTAWPVWIAIPPLAKVSAWILGYFLYLAIYAGCNPDRGALSASMIVLLFWPFLILPLVGAVIICAVVDMFLFGFRYIRSA